MFEPKHDMASVILENIRDKRGLAYLLKIRSEEHILLALNDLAGNRRAYVSNIAKKLFVELPEHLPLSDDEIIKGEALEGKLKALLILARRGKTGGVG